MFDFAWSEIALIAVVALVVIGPKDMPGAIRALAKGVQKARRMAGEFQGHVDEMVREAKLDDVRNQINEIRNFDFRGAVEKTVDRDGSFRKSFTDDPFRAAPDSKLTGDAAAQPGVATAETAGTAAEPHHGDAAALPEPPPAFVPPAAVPPASPPASVAPAAPAFIPPAAARAAEQHLSPAAPEAPHDQKQGD